MLANAQLIQHHRSFSGNLSLGREFLAIWGDRGGTSFPFGTWGNHARGERSKFNSNVGGKRGEKKRPKARRGLVPLLALKKLQKTGRERKISSLN